MNHNEPSAIEPSDLIFLLPEYVRAEAKFTYEAINMVARASDPVLSGMSFETTTESAATQYSLPTGETLEMPEIRSVSESVLNFDDIISGNLDCYFASIYEAAQGLVHSIMPQFFQHISTVVDAFGGSVDARGQPLSHDLIIDMFEKKAISFDDDGNMSKDEILVVHPTMAEKLSQLPPPTPEQEKRWNDMLERKRQEFYARKLTRRIS